MIFVSDVHGAAAALHSLVTREGPTVVLGDLINLTDYRTGEGLLADVLGLEFARKAAEARARGDYQGMRDLWSDVGDRDRLREDLDVALDGQYQQMGRPSREGMVGSFTATSTVRPSSRR